MLYIYISLIIITVYIAIALLIYKFQKKLIFFPRRLRESYQFDFQEPYEEFWISGPTGYKINGLLFKTENPKGCVIYHHGNSKNIQHWGKFSTDFTKRGYDVIFYDYRGFGKSTGLLKEQTLYKDSKKIYQYALDKYPKQDIIQYGRSLGTALATRLARNTSCPLLVLETPYYSMYEMAKIKMPFLPILLILNFHLRQDLDIQNVNCPITIFSGTMDELTPHKHSILLNELNPNSELVVIDNGTHNGLPEYNLYQEKMDDIFKKCRPSN